ncbi:hypothetical protein RM788_05180 [Umezawaea sp. Da 62-37]|nr:hypothetical protein [Umezawaea sp. Da 62-37]WNV87689.1 hypothetical protein RM788_05180 [Umezawaea sp. Da 62-37]
MQQGPGLLGFAAQVERDADVRQGLRFAECVTGLAERIERFAVVDEGSVHVAAPPGDHAAVEQHEVVPLDRAS